MESMVSLLKAVGPAAVNADVRAKILELIQSWATATEGRYDLSYIGEVYRNLQREGFQFPPRVTVASSMIDSSAVCLLCAGKCYSLHPKLTSDTAPRVGRFRCVHAMSNQLYLYQPKTPLSKLRKLLRPAVLKQDAPPTPSWHPPSRPCR